MSYTLEVTLEYQVLTYAYADGLLPHLMQCRNTSKMLTAASTSRCTVVLEHTLLRQCNISYTLNPALRIETILS